MTAGADQGFQVKGGGGAVKKIVPSGGRREHFWGISCEKNHDFMPKNHIFSNFRGDTHRVCHPPWIHPWTGGLLKEAKFI